MMDPPYPMVAARVFRSASLGYETASTGRNRCGDCGGSAGRCPGSAEIAGALFRCQWGFKPSAHFVSAHYGVAMQQEQLAIGLLDHDAIYGGQNFPCSASSRARFAAAYLPACRTS